MVAYHIGDGSRRCDDSCWFFVQRNTAVGLRSPAQKVYILHKKRSLSGALCVKPRQSGGRGPLSPRWRMLDPSSSPSASVCVSNILRQWPHGAEL
jgi:hypothetical protein